MKISNASQPVCISSLSNVQNNYSLKQPGSNNDLVNFSGTAKLFNKYNQAKQVNVISFGRQCYGKAKNRGLLMHIAHLPAKRSCIGQFLDPETNRFIKFLHDARQTHWIINPLTPIGDDLCPYNSSSRYDRNKYFINLNVLTSSEYGCLLEEDELPEDIPTQAFTLDMLEAQKGPRFKKAFVRFKELAPDHTLKTEFNKFCQDKGPKWLDNNSIYEGIFNFLKRANINNVNPWVWKTWPDRLKMFPENTKGMAFEKKIEHLKSLNIGGNTFNNDDFDKIEQFRFEQFLFKRQFNQFKKQLDDNGIKLFVDLAYAIDPKGKDVWANKNIVALDENYDPKRITGCMPENAYPNTQIWNQAVWNCEHPAYWEYQENSMREILEEGCVRLDHFGGLINRGAIPSKVKGKDGKEYPIEEAIKKKIELEHPYTSVRTKKETTIADIDLWRPEWLEDVSKFTNSRGETIIDLYLRVAKEAGLKPEDTFIVEDLGGVCDTETFKEVMKKYKDVLSGLRVPVQFGIGEDIGRDKILALSKDDNPHNPYRAAKRGNVETIALISGSHDTGTQMDTINELISKRPDDESQNKKRLKDSIRQMERFLRLILRLNKEQLETKTEENYYNISRAILKWMYTRPAKHVHTTISDALGIYFRPNIPQFHNNHQDKYLMKTTKEGLLPFWSRQFSKGFLDSADNRGVNPGYKDRAENFVKMMQDLYPEQTTTA